MLDYTITHCPYCEAPYTGKYEWRLVSINSDANIPGEINSLRAVEIYCTKCQTTLSITPLSEK